MKQIKETWYEVKSPDGSGMYDNVVGKFRTEEGANKYKNSFNDSWPRRVEENSIFITIWDSCEEALEAKNTKKRLQEEMRKLQAQIDSMN